MSDKSVSIVVPVYRLKSKIHWFEKAFEGIVNQTHTNWEVVIVCDDAVDKDIEIVKNTISKYPDKRIKVYRSDRQLWPEGAKNAAFPYTSGEYLIFHDQDDFSHPDRIEKLLSVVNDGIAGSFVRVNYAYANSEHSSLVKQHSGQTLNFLIDKNKIKVPVHFSSAIISRDLFTKMGGFGGYKYWSDAMMGVCIGYIREILDLPPIPIYPEPLFEWNRHGSSVTTLAQNIPELKRSEETQRSILLNQFRSTYIKYADNKKENKNIIIKSLELTNNLKDLIELKLVS